MRALGISARELLARFELVQPMYNLAKRQAEVEILLMAAAEQLGVIPYSPLGGGLLTGKYATDARPDRGRLVEDARYQKRYGDDEHYKIAERLSAYASDQGVHPVTLAVAWVGSHPAVTAPIIGARDVEQLEPSLAAAEFEMSAELRAALSALTPPVPLAHDRSEERPD